jgi:hypothetical protein
MHLINFDSDNVRVVEAILIELGISSELGKFLTSHLIQVLRKQQADTEIISVELLKIHDCSGEGYQPEGGLIANLDKICIPVDVKVNLSSNCKTVILELHIQILADNSAQKNRIETNVFVKNQSVA